MGLSIYKVREVKETVAGWSYTGFMSFRRELCRMAFGVEIETMQGFDGTTEWDKQHPLYELMYHSDCDGDLSQRQCKKIYPELRKYALKFSDTYDQNQATSLCDAMEEVSNADEWENSKLKFM